MSGVLVNLQRIASNSDDAEALEQIPSKESASAVCPETVKGRLNEDEVDDEGRNCEGIRHCGLILGTAIAVIVRREKRLRGDQGDRRRDGFTSERLVR